ncbi:MAG: hypothetical protein GAK30_02429 [Paracidovorax wautersii]|uniref:Uncharacterized protein n=1 Tax=Paracidovorax wautersii TaxID=1177982 RepID=A0A7V8JQ54_9BURK|nr:MAG: hypothetical protein GAK30_02429 [Paracidovorax wautersii]
MHSMYRLACVCAAASFAFQAHAASFASSASTAGSASSGSVSDSLKGSSNSSRGDDDKVADGDYRITHIAQAGDRADHVQLTLAQDGGAQRQVVLELPATTLAAQKLGVGDTVHAQNRVYGYEFARADTRETFYLVLTDDWQADMASRPVTAL